MALTFLEKLNIYQILPCIMYTFLPKCFREK